MLTIAFGIAPSLAVGLLMLQSISVEGSIVEPGPEAYAYSVAVASILPLVLVLIPGYPLSMSVVFDKKFSRVLSVLTIVATVFLALPAVILIVSGDAGVFRDAVLNYASISLALVHRASCLFYKQLSHLR